jgi:hypothetical protein
MDKVVEDTCVRELNSVKWFQPHAVLVRGFVIWSMTMFQMKGSNGRKSISQPKCMKEVDMKIEYQHVILKVYDWSDFVSDFVRRTLYRRLRRSVEFW